MYSIRRCFLTLLIASCATLLNTAAWAAGDAAAGKEKSVTCQSCHGATGNETLNATYPRLAGQYENYLEQALKSYRSGERKNPIMAGFAAALSDQDIADLAAFFSAQKSPLQIIPKK